MSKPQVAARNVKLSVTNVGGIDRAEVELSPGVTILTGRNATNRTSLLQALMAALGSDKPTLKAGADHGSVELQIDDETYTRNLSRENGSVVMSGDPFLDDATLADLFAFLLESNQARLAVARGENLHDVIMRPIDTDDLEAQIAKLTDEREAIRQELDELEELSAKYPKVEQRLKDIEDEIADKRSELETLEETIDEKDAEVESQKEKKDDLESQLDELNTVRSELKRVRRQIETQKESIDALEDERETVASDLSDFEDVSGEDEASLEAEIDRLRTKRSKLDDSIDKLQSVIQFNQDRMEGGVEIVEQLDTDSDTDEPTEKLLEDTDDVLCWTCGSNVDTAQIEGMIDQLRDLHSRHIEDRSEIDAQIESLRSELSELQATQRKHEELESRLAEIETELENRRGRLEDLTETREDLSAELEDLEEAVESLRSTETQDELIALHKEANELEVAIERLESDRDDVLEEIEYIDERLGDEEQLESQLDEIEAEITDLRSKIDRIERSAIDEFNEHMETLLDTLEYENLERIWLERTEREERQGRRTVTKTHFDLHVVRSTDDDRVYEDEIEHLSESEREVTGLVFALAGYLAHDLHETIPFMIVDSIEAIDPERIADLIAYFTDYPDYLVAALLEDDAQELDADYARVTDI